MITRVLAIEYRHASDAITELASKSEIRHERAAALLIQCGARIAKSLNLANNPIEVTGNGFTVAGVAGLARLSPSVEIEIAPKFLNSATPSWREDFFLAATLSRFGRILPAEQLRSSPGSRGDLATLVARGLIEGFRLNRGRPLRTYRNHRWDDFVVDGDVDAETVALPSSEGFSQEALIYDRQNRFNVVIKRASEILLFEVGEPSLRRQLARIQFELSPQSVPPRGHHSALPQRLSRWKTVFDLSRSIVEGFGTRFGETRSTLPGYVVDTWRVWQDLITWSLRAAMGKDVSVLPSLRIGDRCRVMADDPAVRGVFVNPDLIVTVGERAAIVDAKYKGRSGQRPTIAEADLYEAIVFAKAAKLDRAILLYPFTQERADRTPGEFSTFETVKAMGIEVIGMTIDVRGISSEGGLGKLSHGLAEGIREAIAR